MGKTTTHSPSETNTNHNLIFLLLTLLPVILSITWYQLDSFDAAVLPMHELTRDTVASPLRNGLMLTGSERIGEGKLVGPEDVLYDFSSGIIYTGCADGWIKRVNVSDSGVEDWVNTGGRPLGLARSRGGDLIVADSYKGLLKVSEEGAIELLTDSAEGQEFKLTDGVDIAEDGIIYFTDASYKYNLHDHALDILEGRPYGRLLSYNPFTKETKVLVRDLYFPNGIALSPDQKSAVFCETPMRRCKKYYIEGEKKGSTYTFLDRLPGFPDNIHYDGEGHFWIALAGEVTELWHWLQAYPVLRKVTGMITKYRGLPHLAPNSGAMLVDVQGKVVEHYQDPALSYLASAFKIGDYLYAGSIGYTYLVRLNITRYPATAVA